MCMATKECILRWARGYWPTFNRMPYDFDHFYKIAEKEGIEVVIESESSLDIEMDCLHFVNDGRISINGSCHVLEGDSLVCTFAKLFNYYYLNKDSFKNFHSCMNPEGEEYRKLCLAAGFLAVVPSQMLIDDLRMGLDPSKKYKLSYPVAHRRARLLLNHLTQLENRNSHNALRRLSGDDGIALCKDHLVTLERILGNSGIST